MVGSEKKIYRELVAHIVDYVVRGVPSLPSTQRRGMVLEPVVIRICYLSHADEKLGNIQVTVSGHLMDGAVRVSEEFAVEHFYGHMTDWPGWVLEEVRINDPDRTDLVNMASKDFLHRSHKIKKELTEESASGLTAEARMLRQQEADLWFRASNELLFIYGSNERTS